MKQEDKELLLKDLSARLYYRPTVLLSGREHCLLCGIDGDEVYLNVDSDSFYVENIKPYLRSMSSMTEEERKDFWWNVLDMDWEDNLDYDDESETVPFPFVEDGCGFYIDNYYLKDTFAVIDWLNAHHFDYRGLIEKGLAAEAPEGMYNIKEK